MREVVRELRPYSPNGRLIVLSYSLATEYEPSKPTHAISVMGPQYPPVLPGLPDFDSVLSLRFEDTHEGSDEHRFTEEDARRIWDFITGIGKQQHDLVVHCEAGMSRSAGIAVGLTKCLLPGQEAWYFEQHVPNRHVAALLVSAFKSNLQ
ncbi:MAG: hypothetical protein K1X67_15435 [Fimbriimonadaceae bacterium]|nr:hypothetical protein [Fimbriimonadaceae bacterium]